MFAVLFYALGYGAMRDVLCLSVYVCAYVFWCVRGNGRVGGGMRLRGGMPQLLYSVHSAL